MPLFEADAEQAKATGGMISLRLDAPSAEALVIEGAEPVEDLHLTLAYLGQDVTDWSPHSAMILAAGIAELYAPLACAAFAHATFNPAGEEPCAVYLIGDSKELETLRADVALAAYAEYNVTDAHAPFVAHVTAGYDLEAADLAYTGPITFDAIEVHWAGETHSYPFSGFAL